MQGPISQGEYLGQKYCLVSIFSRAHNIDHCTPLKHFILQSDVISESEDILKLGLLFGEDIDATTEDLLSVLSFQHKLLQEYLAAVYIAENIKLDTGESFLTEAFPSLEKIETHIEVVLFAIGILADSDASEPLINCVAKCTAEHIYKKLPDYGPYEKLVTSILERCQKESGIPVHTINKHLSVYPACRKPLAEVLSNTEVAYIDGVAENDTLQLSASDAKIIVKLYDNSNNKFDRLWEALHSINANVIALLLCDVHSVNVTKLHNFFKLKYLKMNKCKCSEEEMENLSQSINSWGPQPQLMHCELCYMPIPESVMTALSKCIKLSTLDFTGCDVRGKLSGLMAPPPPELKVLSLGWCSLQATDVDLITQAVRRNNLNKLQELYLNNNPMIAVGGKLSGLMVSPPPELKVLSLGRCSLQAADVDLITQAVRRNSVNKLQKLNLYCNPIGEVAVGSLLEALISTRPQTKLDLELGETDVDEDGRLTNLSNQFSSKWEKRLKDTAICIRWTLYD